MLPQWQPSAGLCQEAREDPSSWEAARLVLLAAEVPLVLCCGLRGYGCVGSMAGLGQGLAGAVQPSRSLSPHRRPGDRHWSGLRHVQVGWGLPALASVMCSVAEQPRDERRAQ